MSGFWSAHPTLEVIVFCGIGAYVLYAVTTMIEKKLDAIARALDRIERHMTLNHPDRRF